MRKDLEKQGESHFAEGALSILSVIRNKSRPIYGIYLLPSAKKEEKNILRILSLAKKNKIPVRLSDEAFFEKVTTGHTHGGVIAEVGPRVMCTPEEVLDRGNGFVFLICGIEDPFNFGCAVRSFYAAGAGGMLLTPRNWLSAAGVTIRASAGTCEALPCAAYESAEELCRLAHEKGYRIVCATEQDSVDLYHAELKKPLLLIVGGEKRGISKDFLKFADERVRIPYGRPFSSSLTASAACAVCAFEILRREKL
ncbi:MAG: RNA methyltransferase [Clostridia bacterium]|nr:RNA methyltransferase [Clostridia bacterium]